MIFINPKQKHLQQGGIKTIKEVDHANSKVIQVQLEWTTELRSKSQEKISKLLTVESILSDSQLTQNKDTQYVERSLFIWIKYLANFPALNWGCLYTYCTQ